MKPINILLVEDNEGDILLTTEALEECKIVNKITIIKDGKAAVNFFEYLNKNDIPDIVLLDVNLPKMSGHEVLMYIKNHDNYKQIPVIMLTTSSSEKDIMISYKNHVNCYITKPVDAIDFIKAISKIEDFWINIVSIPRN
ncbi:CheY-like chemotaxis protein [Mucilaginibacter frigoritolerans]|jgi:CheY-like chemotaxis protein|uniref:CheY-like chemotaxis protein n=1 Tax=Mucilaginibacter frigoritolerans TaxID=652788 RepID=A0A562TPN6_9SPHI|nr:response regulator [Mucilaginibacter frigoritolerans]TWI95541.1 CheY-like chemotaxis protein [Mucilaginibacter frigoritolerans]